MSTSKKILLEKNLKIAEISFALMLFVMFLILLISSVSAYEVSCGTVSFNSGAEIRDFVNSLGLYTHIPNDQDPNTGAIKYDTVSIAKVCELKGYPKVVSTVSSSYTSCGDNTMAYFDKTKNDFVIINACQYNYMVDKLTCEKTCNVECSSNSDCNDDNLYTEDKCINPGQASSYCDYKAISCINNNDCGYTGFTGKEFCSNNDIFKNYQESKCVNSGKSSSYCTNTTTPTFLIDCGDTLCGDYGNNYCKDGNVYHSRVCNDKGCLFGSCYNTLSEDEKLVETCNNGCLSGACKPECTKDSDCGQGKICSNNKCVIIKCNSNSDCGTDGYLNQLFCKNNNVFDKYITSICNNPGKTSSSCSNLTSDTQKLQCTNGCTNGECNEEPQECTVNSDCRAKSPSKKYCEDGNVYQDIYDEPACNNGTCSYDVNNKLIKECKKGCRSGLCLETAPLPRDEDNGGILPEEITNNLGAYITLGSSDYPTNYSFTNVTAKIIPLTQDNVKVTTNNSLWIVLLIILVVIFLIILIVLMNV